VALAQLLPDAIENSEGDKDKVLALAQVLTPEDVQFIIKLPCMVVVICPWL
jgi:DNA polymerase-3 subunit gamma/tau